MLQETTPHKVKSTGDFEAISFSFNASAHAFKIISDNLYSKPVEAIVRELSCNAVDSHIKAGKADVPFVVKLPNRLDNTFYIQDFGTGLTPQEMREVYTVVFKSDKQHTNDYTGCFGLGSKTPFSVVSQFSVESVVKGRKWIYSAYLDDQRVPAIADISKGGFDTDEANGVKISFSVPQNKVTEFVSATERVLPYFSLKPQILGGTVIVKEIEYARTTEDYGLRNGDSYSSTPKAIMGNVAYEINTSALGVNVPRKLDLFFELGELTPTPSREQLQYDDRTKAAIKRKHAKFVAEFLVDEIEIINKAPTLMEARMLLKALEGHSFLDRKKIPNVLWKDQPFTRLKDLTVPHRIRAFSMGSELKTWAGKELSCAGFLNFQGKFIIPDETTGFISRTRYASKYTSKKHVLLSQNDVMRQEQINCLKYDVGFDDSRFVKASTLDKPPRDAVSKTSGVTMAKGTFRVFDTTNYKHYKADYWRAMEKDEDLSNVYYVYCSRGSWGEKPDDVRTAPQRLREIVNQFKTIGFSFKVVGVLPSAKGKVPDDWKPLNDTKVFIEWLARTKSIKNMLVAQQTNEHAGTFKRLTEERRGYSESHVDKLKDSNLKSYIVESRLARKSCNQIQSLNFLAKRFGIEIKCDFDALKKRMQDLRDKYILLRNLETYGISEEATQQLYDYINMVHDQ